MNPARLQTGGVLWLAGRGGAGDRTRIALTAFGAALASLALLSAATVAAIGPRDGPYGPALLAEPGLHPGVVIALVLLCVPVVGFAVQCSRIGAPARDRRLAALRLAGATPRDIVRVVSAETGLATALGAALGLGVFLALRQLPNPLVPGLVTSYSYDASGNVTQSVTDTGLVRNLPTDVLPGPWAIALIVIGLPLLAALLSASALRTVVVGPLGVTRSHSRRPARVFPALLFLGGLLGLVLFAAIGRLLEQGGNITPLMAVVFLVMLLLVLVGLVLGSVALAAMVGRLVARHAGSPALLIASRRLAADPHAAGRSFGVLLVTVVFGAGALAYRSFLLGVTDPLDTFYLQTMDLVLLVVAVAVVVASLGLLVAATENLLSRRRTLAALRAGGTPARTLRRALLAESALPLVFVLPLAVAAGVLAVRGVVNPMTASYGQHGEPQIVVGVPWTGLAVLTLGSLLVAVLVVSLSLVFLRSSTDVAELRAT